MHQRLFWARQLVKEEPKKISWQINNGRCALVARGTTKQGRGTQAGRVCGRGRQDLGGLEQEAYPTSARYAAGLGLSTARQAHLVQENGKSGEAVALIKECSEIYEQTL